MFNLQILPTENTYPNGKISPCFSIYNLRNLYKGEDLILTTDNMSGSDSLGSNTICINYLTADIGYFNMLGGVYNASLGKWVKARAQVGIEMTKQSLLSEIENEYSTKLK